MTPSQLLTLTHSRLIFIGMNDLPLCAKDQYVSKRSVQCDLLYDQRVPNRSNFRLIVEKRMLLMTDMKSDDTIDRVDNGMRDSTNSLKYNA